MTNPLKVEGEATKATEGLGLAHDAAETFSAISQGNWAEGLMNAAGGAMGVAGFLADPLAGLAGAGFGWLVEHVPFLREPLDWLTGDQEQLDSMSKTWGNIANHVEQVSTDLRQWVKTDSGQWTGEEFRAYERFGVDKADTYGSVATGAGVAGAIAECTATAVKYANKALGWCKKLSKAFSNATGLFSKLENVFQGAMNALTKLSKGVRTGATNFSVANAITSKATDLDALKHGVSEAKKHVVDGVKSAPADSVPKLGVDLGKEAGKVFDSQSGNLFDSEPEQKQGG
ncbi:hypothetical protein AB0E59_09705 [Lentzea sp. NPDC034063]|uniref:hypothetical protein n=1 Tax=unclassified Lentzea TaxID=2643253 RepID=UPI0033FA8295